MRNWRWVPGLGDSDFLSLRPTRAAGPLPRRSWTPGSAASERGSRWIMSRIESLTRARIDRSKELATKVGWLCDRAPCRPRASTRAPFPPAACSGERESARSGRTGWVGLRARGEGAGGPRRDPRLQHPRSFCAGILRRAELGHQWFGGTECFGPLGRKLLW